jgi:hypothetical protein
VPVFGSCAPKVSRRGRGRGIFLSRRVVPLVDMCQKGVIEQCRFCLRRFSGKQIQRAGAVSGFTTLSGTYNRAVHSSLLTSLHSRKMNMIVYDNSSDYQSVMSYVHRRMNIFILLCYSSLWLNLT